MQIGDYQYKIVTSDSEFQRILELRKTVFVKEQGIPQNLEIDNKDNTSIHLMVCDGEQCVATGRLTPLSAIEAMIARIAVRMDYRSLGIGKSVILKLEEEARSRNFNHLILKPHAYLEKFYNELGYKKVQNLGKVGEHPLILMEKLLS